MLTPEKLIGELNGYTTNTRDLDRGGGRRKREHGGHKAKGGEEKYSLPQFICSAQFNRSAPTPPAPRHLLFVF